MDPSVRETENGGYVAEAQPVGHEHLGGMTGEFPRALGQSRSFCSGLGGLLDGMARGLGKIDEVHDLGVVMPLLEDGRAKLVLYCAEAAACRVDLG